MRFKMIKLTYFKPEKRFGTAKGPTSKIFYANPFYFETITPYEESTKILFESGREEEVCESVVEIYHLIKGNKKDGH